MSENRLQLTADALAVALADAFKAWKREAAPSETSEIAYATWVESIHAHLELKPGKASALVVEVIDRRPGKSNLFSYMIEPSPHQSRLIRN